VHADKENALEIAMPVLKMLAAPFEHQQGNTIKKLDLPHPCAT
jgi:hypothetical protein